MSYSKDDEEAKIKQRTAEFTTMMVMMLDGSSVFGSTSNSNYTMLGRLGAVLYEDEEGGIGYELGTDGKTHLKHYVSRSRQDPAAQRAFNAITTAADEMGVSRDVLFQAAYAARHGGTLAGEEGQREAVIQGVEFLKEKKWGEKYLASHPQLTELYEGIKKLSDLHGQDYLDALNKDPRLAELMLNPELGARVAAISERREYEALGFDPEGGKPLTAEQMRDVAGRLFVKQYFGEAAAKDILSKLEDGSPCFTKEQIEANPALKEFEGKSAKEILSFAKDKMNVDVSELLQTAPGNIPIVKNYNEIDAKTIHGVNIGRLKAAIFGNETGGRKDAYTVENQDGAIGIGQILRSNIESAPGRLSWCEEALGRRMTVEELKNDPNAQQAIISFKMQQFVELAYRHQLNNYSREGTPDKLVMDVAAKWHSNKFYDNAVASGVHDRNETTEKYANDAWNKYVRAQPTATASLLPDSLPSLVASRNELRTLNFQLGPAGLIRPIMRGGGILGLPLEVAYRIPVGGDYGDPRTGHTHGGIDMARADVDGSSIEGANIHPAADGTVTRVFRDDDGRHGGGYGNAIEIKHTVNGQTIYTRYAHMQQPPGFQTGDPVTTRDVIGTVGQTGEGPDLTGAHLHFEVRDANGTAMDPKPWLAPIPTEEANAAPTRGPLTTSVLYVNPKTSAAPDLSIPEVNRSSFPANPDTPSIYGHEDKVTLHLIGDSNAKFVADYLREAFKGEGYKNVEIVNGGIGSAGFNPGHGSPYQPGSADVRDPDSHLTLEQRADVAVADVAKAPGKQQIVIYAGANDGRGAFDPNYEASLDRVFHKLAVAAQGGTPVTIFGPVYRGVGTELAHLVNVADDFRRIAGKNGLRYVDPNIAANGRPIDYTHAPDTFKVHLTKDPKGYGALANVLRDSILHPPVQTISSAAPLRASTDDTSKPGLTPTGTPHRGDVSQLIPPVTAPHDATPEAVHDASATPAPDDAPKKADEHAALSSAQLVVQTLAAAEQRRTGGSPRTANNDRRTRFARRHDKMHSTMMASKKVDAKENPLTASAVASPAPGASNILKA